MLRVIIDAEIHRLVASRSFAALRKPFKPEPQSSLLRATRACLKLAWPVFRTKRRIILFIAAFVVVVGVVLFLALSEGAPTATTENGRNVTIEKVTFGTHHSFFKGRWWVRVLRPMRGKRWAAQRGAYEVRFTNDVPALMVWTRWEGISRSNNVAVEATLLDQLGTESQLIAYRWHDGLVTYSNAPGTEASRVAWLLSNFPRRSKTLR